MKVDVIRNEKNTLEIALVGEGHTFANLLRKTLKSDDHVVHAAYKVGHPLVDKERPVLILETDGKETPKEALIRAAEKIKEQINEFGKQF